MIVGDAQPLPWATRIKVAIGAARGLTFLHDSDQQVIYRDFKASNILLDSVCWLSISIAMLLWAFGENANYELVGVTSFSKNEGKMMIERKD